MEGIGLTKAERIFRGWMLVSALVYACGVPIFFFGGGLIVRMINAVSARLLPLPLYPLPPDGAEGAFWRVLGVSMMAMLTWACFAIARDVRQRHWLVSIILLSKACSTGSYLLLFAVDHYLAYLVGALTDGPIFVATLVLWFPASAGGGLLAQREEQILASVGEAMFTGGGTFPVSFAVVREACLARARILLASHDYPTLLSLRLLLRFLDWAPVILLRAKRSLCALPVPCRAAFLERIERNHWSPLRMMLVAVKMYVALPFLDQSSSAAAVGYVVPRAGHARSEGELP
jgi:hypothetical protein